MIIGAVGAVLVLAWVMWRRHRRRSRSGPLAGYDTGVRSPYRVPGGLWRNRRTLAVTPVPVLAPSALAVDTLQAGWVAAVLVGGAAVGLVVAALRVRPPR